MTNHWTRAARTDRWHRLWVEHLQAQTALNPNHPAAKSDGRTDQARYTQAAQNYRDGGSTLANGMQPLWDGQVDATEQRTQHDLVATLEVFNARAGASTAHLGLTSCDITDTANQWAIAESFHELLGDVRALIYRLDKTMVEQAELRLVARTHGQPAQLTTYGHRVATILGPLCDWYERAARWGTRYPMRPPHGAVGTAADLQRVLTGWEPDGNAPTMASGGQRSDSEGSLGVSIPPGASEGSGEAPGPLSEVLSRAIQGIGRFEQIALTNIREGRDVRLVLDPTTGETNLELVNRSNGTTTFRVDPPPDLTDSSLIGDTSYRPAETPPVFDSPERVGIYTAQLATRLGFSDIMDVTRQVYHRSYDLHTAALLAELASIAQTWATDRRLESMLGLGTETPVDGQVGSSAMPHKDNPRYSERMCALAVVTRCYLTASAETAGMEWLEGDVSTSAARRIILPGMFDAATRMVEDWRRVALSWTINKSAIADEVMRHQLLLATGALLQAAVEKGMSRPAAHDAIRRAWQSNDTRGKLASLVAAEGWPLSAKEMRDWVEWVQLGPVGTVAEQIGAVHETARMILE